MTASKRARTVLILIACALSITAVAMFGQAVNGTLLGTLTDSSGAVVPGAQVTITETGTGIPHSTQSNASGNFVFPNLPPGMYSITSEAHGFKKETRTDVRLDVNQTVRVDMTMQPGAVTETVEVTGAVPLLKTDRADVSQNIETTQLEQLPVGGANRNFQSLLALVPGAGKPRRDHSEFFNAQDTLSTEVNGQSREFNQLAIEGVNDDERTGLLQIYVPPAEAIQTVDVTTSNYAAEFGRAGGAVTNVILKSGTNDFHGSLYEYNRVSALQARTYFQRTPAGPSPIARTTFNYYGGTIGGPIIKDKTFFFFDLLRINDIRGQFQNTQLPNDAFRNGDVRAAITSGKANIYNPFTGNADGTNRQVIFASSAPGVATIPGRNGPVDAYNPACTGAPTCNNVIPLALMDPISLKILALVPHTNLPGLSNNFQENTQFRKDSWSFDTKIDHNFSQKDRLAFRFSRAVQNPLQQPMFGLAGGPIGFQGPGSQTEQSGAINETHIFSPTLVMETRAGISHYRNIAVTSDHGSTATTALGIPGANLDAFTSGLTQVEIGNGFGNPFVGYSASQPWDRGETNIDVVNSWTKISGNHTFKWGADVRRLRDDLVQAQTFGPRGHFVFGTGTTSLNGDTGCSGKACASTQANNFAAFLLDAPTQVGRDISLVSGSWRETEAFFFGQDTWHASSKLTIDAGLRWELYVPATPSRPGRYSNYDPSINRLVIAGVAGNPLNLGRETYYKYFAPRVGIAYRVSEETVVRAGFGISYEPFTNNQYAFNFPVRQNQGTNQANSFAFPFFANGLLGDFPNGFPAPSTIAIDASGTVNPSNGDPYNVVDKHFQEPYVESYNLSIQRSLPANFVMDLAYVGNHGVKIPVAYNVNAAFSPAVNPNGTLMATTCAVQPLCAQFGRTASTTFLFKPTVSNYNSLQARFDRKFKNGFLLTTSYTWAKALAYRSDMGADDGGPDNYLDFQRNYTVTSRNRAHTFVQSYVYELPFGKNKRFLNSGAASWILGGWGVSGVLTRMSGTPLHFTADGKAPNAPGSTQYPNQVAPFHMLGGIDTALWFDTTAFVQPQGNGVLGNMRRYQFSGPGFFNLDAAVFRNFPIRERMGFEFRAEAFSVTNTPHFSNPSTSITSSTYGRITGTGDQNGGVGDGNRTMELSARFTF
ncbi:MAG TPA: TonB-dependent receptor [Terriglobales bacterium]|nr:TonB-dependent receptor [Terriglobales bacterium]